MRIVMYLVLIAVMTTAYASRPDLGFAPGFVKFVPDFLTMVTVLFVVVVGTRVRFRYVSFKYWLIFGLIAFAVACGPLVNQEPPGAMVNGMRYYLRAIPFFFVPAVFDFTEQDIKRYLRLLLGLSLLQAPLGVYQRYETAAHNNYTGDFVFGTLLSSGILSLFLISALCIMGSLMLRGRVSKLWYGICFVALVIPMSINETKVTVFLLPLGLLTTFLLGSPPGKRIRVLVTGLALLTIAGLIFVPLYDYFNTLHNPVPFTIKDFFTNPDLFNSYMNKNAEAGTTEEAGRVDSLLSPFIQLGHDPVKLFFGLGLGNASQSSLGSQFAGQYQVMYWNYTSELSITTFLFELGLFGTALILILHFMVLLDAWYLTRHDRSLLGDIAPGYMGVWVTITIGLFYLVIHTFECLSYVFWFLSGLMAARRCQLSAEGLQARPRASAISSGMALKAAR